MDENVWAGHKFTRFVESLSRFPSTIAVGRDDRVRTRLLEGTSQATGHTRQDRCRRRVLRHAPAGQGLLNHLINLEVVVCDAFCARHAQEGIKKDIRREG